MIRITGISGWRFLHTAKEFDAAEFGHLHSETCRSKGSYPQVPDAPGRGNRRTSRSWQQLRAKSSTNDSVVIRQQLSALNAMIRHLCPLELSPIIPRACLNRGPASVSPPHGSGGGAVSIPEPDSSQEYANMTIRGIPNDRKNLSLRLLGAFSRLSLIRSPIRRRRDSAKAPYHSFSIGLGRTRFTQIWLDYQNIE